jgi:AcrR family transcriptional regulator
VNRSPDRIHTHQTDEDLNTRARIRKAALVEFARHGFKGASIRGIARAADVSPGLVQHHFGTKDGLREACDEYVMEFMTETQYQLVQRDTPSLPESIRERLDELQPMIDYLIMSLASGSDAAAQWFREITDYTHDALTSGRIGPPLDPSLDTRAIAATQAAMALGVTAFYRNIQQVLGVEDESELMARIGRARLFLASEQVVGSAVRKRLSESLDQYERAKTTGKPPPHSKSDSNHHE